MDRSQLSEYLTRIGLDCAPAADADGLAQIQRAHLSSVPFENLDIAAGRIPLSLDGEALFDKIVKRRRGGICYEQNLLFADALRALGFTVAIKGGRHPKYGDDMDHLFLLVDAGGIDGDEGQGSAQLIADVGFAANFACPLRLVADKEQEDGRDRFVLKAAPEIGEGYLRLMRIPGLQGDAEPQEMFAFGPQVFEPQDCRERCDWFSTAPESRFTQGPLVTIDGEDGRKTLSAHRFIETRDGVRKEVQIETSEQFRRYLRDEFGLDPEGVLQ